MKPTLQIRLAHGFRQKPERPEGEKVFNPFYGFPEEKRSGPAGQGGLPPEPACGFSRAGQDTETDLAKIDQKPGLFAVSIPQQPANEVGGIFRPPFLTGSAVKALPEGPLRPLLAAPKEGPAHARLVVLCFRKSQRQERHVTFVRDGARQPGQFLRPVDVPMEYFAVDALGRLLTIKTFQCGQNLPGNMLQPRTQFKDLFALTHQPSMRIVRTAGGGMVRAVRPPPDQRRRHHLGIGQDPVRVRLSIPWDIR
jgi:hypothetical protein